MDTTTATGIVIIGGGPAGLQAALTVGRVHRRAVLLDSGRYRNAPARHMHNMITRDGTPPAEFRTAAQRDLARYRTVELRAVAATQVRQVADHRFQVDLADGASLTARAVVLATGVRDILPDIPGLAELWGTLAAHCPFCHGHEFAGRRVAILGAGPAQHLAGLLRPITDDLLVLANGEAGGPDGVTTRSEPVVALERVGDRARVTFAAGPPETVDGLFLVPHLEQAAPFAAQLGLELNPSGAVRVNERGQTSLAGVLAAGDMAHVPALPMPMASVVASAAAGAMAGGSVVAELITAPTAE